MRSIQARFNRISKANPLWSSFVSFTEGIKGQGFTKRAIYKWFEELVEKDDYARTDKREIFTQLRNL